MSFLIDDLRTLWRMRGLLAVLTRREISARFAGAEALPPWLVYGGEDAYERSGVRVIGWRNLQAAVSSADTS